LIAQLACRLAFGEGRLPFNFGRASAQRRLTGSRQRRHGVPAMAAAEPATSTVPASPRMSCRGIAAAPCSAVCSTAAAATAITRSSGPTLSAICALFPADNTDVAGRPSPAAAAEAPKRAAKLILVEHAGLVCRCRGVLRGFSILFAFVGRFSQRIERP